MYINPIKMEWTEKSAFTAQRLFFASLQDLLAERNAKRTIYSVQTKTVETFNVAWASLNLDASGLYPLATMECRISYCTEGSAACNGTDRGRLLGVMDEELTSALLTEAQSAVDFTGCVATRIFWSAPRFLPVTSSGDRIGRVAKVEVISYQEPCEEIERVAS